MVSKAHVELNGDFSAEELDEILQKLADLRASMTPAVSLDPPYEQAPMLEQPQITIIKARTLVDGGLRFWLRHEGFGWLAISLSAQVRNELFKFLGKQAGHTHTFH